MSVETKVVKKTQQYCKHLYISVCKEAMFACLVPILCSKANENRHVWTSSSKVSSTVQSKIQSSLISIE